MTAAFGDEVQRAGLLDRSQVELLNHRARLKGGGPARHALELGLLSLDEVMTAYARCVGLPALRAIDLDRINRHRAGAFPRRLAERLRVIPVFQVGRDWHVLSDRPLSAERRQEISELLGVSLIVRAIPPFLYSVIATWMRGEAIEPGLRELGERLFPRFVVAPEPVARGLAPAVTSRPSGSGLPRRLAEASGGADCLRQTAEYMTTRAGCAALWRVDGQTLRQAIDDELLSLASLAEPERLTVADRFIVKPLPSGWSRLLPGQSCDRMAVRPVRVQGRLLALLVLGSKNLPIDGAALAMMDDAALALSDSLHGLLGQPRA